MVVPERERPGNTATACERPIIKASLHLISCGFFGEKKVTPKVTLGLIEDIVTNKATFENFGPFSTLEYYKIEGYEPDFNNKEYCENVKARMQDRLDFVSKLEGMDRLPQEAIEAIENLIKEIK